MLLFVSNNTDSPSVTTTSHHNSVASVVLDHFSNLSSGDIKDNCIIDSSMSTRSSDGSCIVGNQVWDSFHSSAYPLHLAELVSCLVSSNAMTNESTFHIVEKSKELSCLLNGDDIHETSRVCLISTHTTINLDQSLHHNLGNIRIVECML